MKKQYEARSQKSKDKAKSSRENGNKAFKIQDYLQSLLSYGECAKQASGDTEEFSVALANRSAALLRLRRYSVSVLNFNYSSTSSIFFPLNVVCYLIFIYQGMFGGYYRCNRSKLPR